MFSQNEIDWANHVAWFERNASDPRKHLLAFESSGILAGFLSFHESEIGSNAEWGFYTAPDAPRGYGTLLCTSGLHYGFFRIGLHKISGRVIDMNRASLALHEKLGFSMEGRLREEYFDGSDYREVCCFGLLRQEWRERACL
jgi:RimJ/RimL family protein N-acetyltransferase